MAGLLAFNCDIGLAPAAGPGGESEAAPEPLAAAPDEASYEIGGECVSLSGGVAVRPVAPDSATRVRTWIWDTPVFGDLDADGDDDAIVWLVHDSGGSGTFHYVAAAIREGGGYRGTRAVRLGDRIAPAGLFIEHRVAGARFLDRRPREPMAAAPTVAVTRYFTAAADGLIPVNADAPDATLFHDWLTLGGTVRAGDRNSRGAGRGGIRGRNRRLPPGRREPDNRRNRLSDPARTASVEIGRIPGQTVDNQISVVVGKTAPFIGLVENRVNLHRAHPDSLP